MVFLVEIIISIIIVIIVIIIVVIVVHGNGLACACLDEVLPRRLKGEVLPVSAQGDGLACELHVQCDGLAGERPR